MTNITYALPILSPCIGVCRLNSQGYCEGCLRNTEEITRWSAMGEGERRYIMDEVLPGREMARG